MKNMVFAFIIGGIVFGTITGVVAYNYNAKDVSYNDTTVENALNELKNNRINENVFGEIISNQNLGTRVAGGRETSINLNKGKYLVIVNSGYSVANSSSTTQSSDYQLILNCSSECNKKFITGKKYQPLGSSHGLDTYTSLYYVEILTDNTKLSSIGITTPSTASVAGHYTALQTVKVN